MQIYRNTKKNAFYLLFPRCEGAFRPSEYFFRPTEFYFRPTEISFRPPECTPGQPDTIILPNILFLHFFLKTSYRFNKSSSKPESASQTIYVLFSPLASSAFTLIGEYEGEVFFSFLPFLSFKLNLIAFFLYFTRFSLPLQPKGCETAFARQFKLV